MKVLALVSGIYQQLNALPDASNSGIAGDVLTNVGAGVYAWVTPARTTQEIDFGLVENDYVTITVVAAWVTSASYITLSILPHLADHDAEDVLIEEIKCTYGNIINNTSFDLYVHAPNGTHGRYLIKAIGA